MVNIPGNDVINFAITIADIAHYPRLNALDQLNDYRFKLVYLKKAFLMGKLGVFVFSLQKVLSGSRLTEIVPSILLYIMTKARGKLLNR